MKNAILILILVTLTWCAPPKVNYPVRFAYIDWILTENSVNEKLAGIGVPGYAKPHIYNYIAFAFWSYRGALDFAKKW